MGVGRCVGGGVCVYFVCMSSAISKKNYEFMITGIR